jgi:hypothetical protein
MTTTVEPRMTFTPEAWRKMVLYGDLCPYEISGLGVVDEVGADYRMTDLLIVEQEVTPIETSLDGEAVANLIVRMVEDGRDPGALKIWWHSHAREAVFWSGEDERTISTFQNDYMISIVTNHAGKMLARVDRYAPRTTTWVWLDPPADAGEPEPADVDAARAQIQALVRRTA